WLTQMGWGKRWVFLEFGQCQLSLWFLRRGGEFLLSLKEELGRSRIVRFLYSNGLRIQRVNMQKAQHTTDLQWNRVSNLEPSCVEVETLTLGHRGFVL
ncbi:hypothetical protein AVEN_106707-2-1, partial [Araneus ventricosus]